MLVAGPIAGWLGNRLGSRTPLLIGIALVAIGVRPARACCTTSPGTIYSTASLTGAGIGLAFASMATLIVEAVPQSQTGVATGMNTIMRSIGGALGAQIAASIVGAHADECALRRRLPRLRRRARARVPRRAGHPAAADPPHRADGRPSPRRADGYGVQVMTIVSRLGSDWSRRRSPFGAKPSAR